MIGIITSISRFAQLPIKNKQNRALPGDRTGLAALRVDRAKRRIGLEVASSPLATINEPGPTAVVSDLGNSAGLIIGSAVRNRRTRPLELMNCRTTIDESEVGAVGAFNLTDGFVRSVKFLLELTARRGIPLKAGGVVATGQTTGIHEIQAGQTAKLEFDDDGFVRCAIVDAAPA